MRPWTKGPWRINFMSHKHVGYRLIENEDREFVCDLEQESARLADADARLIAAAPDLFEALSDLLEAAEANNVERNHMQHAKQALAKALGQ